MIALSFRSMPQLFFESRLEPLGKNTNHCNDEELNMCVFVCICR